MDIRFPTVEVTMTESEAYHLGCRLIYSITREEDERNIAISPNSTEQTWRKSNELTISTALKLMSATNKYYGESLINEFCEKAFKDK